MAASEQCCKPMFCVYLLICACLVLFIGLMLGLTLGLMSLSLVDLEVLAKAGQPQDRKMPIIPQAICSRYGLKVGAKMVVIVRLLLLVFFPISYPISKLLDWLLGKGHFVLLRRAELKTLVDMHGNECPCR